jgi:hypothetical protein
VRLEPTLANGIEAVGFEHRMGAPVAVAVGRAAPAAAFRDHPGGAEG